MGVEIDVKKWKILEERLSSLNEYVRSLENSYLFFAFGYLMGLVNEVEKKVKEES